MSTEVALSSFCGLPASQIWEDFYLWELLLNGRDSDVKHGTKPPFNAIVELGTFQGGFSLYLEVQARNRGMRFRTYDIERPFTPIPGFTQADIFEEHEKIGRWLRHQGPLVLLCDNGDKPRELQTFPQYLHRDSLVVVHDWLTEVFPEDVPSSLSMVYEDVFEQYGSMSRVFEIR